jgi:hypothetical protein
MIPKDCKRLAEVDFPIAVVSKHAAREKSIRHGHPSTLHLWWARRPLAACRAQGSPVLSFKERQGLPAVSFQTELLLTWRALQVVDALTDAHEEATSREHLKEASGIKHRELLRNAHFGPSYEAGGENRHAKD